MTFPTWKLALRAALVVGVLGAAIKAEANTNVLIPGFAGHDPYNTGCFTETWGAVVNNCGSPQSWEIPLPVSGNILSGGKLDAMVSFYAPSSSALPSCLVIATDSVGRELNTPAVASAAAAGNSWSAYVTAYVEYLNSVYLWCTIPQSAKVYQVIYDYP